MTTKIRPLPLSKPGISQYHIYVCKNRWPPYSCMDRSCWRFLYSCAFWTRPLSTAGSGQNPERTESRATALMHGFDTITISNCILVAFGYLRLERTVGSLHRIQGGEYPEGRKRTSSLSNISSTQDIIIYAGYSELQMLWTKSYCRENPSQYRWTKMLNGSQGNHGNTSECTIFDLYLESVATRRLSTKSNDIHTGNQHSFTLHTFRKRWTQVRQHDIRKRRVVGAKKCRVVSKMRKYPSLQNWNPHNVIDTIQKFMDATTRSSSKHNRWRNRK